MRGIKIHAKNIQRRRNRNTNTQLFALDLAHLSLLAFINDLLAVKAGALTIEEYLSPLSSFY